MRGVRGQIIKDRMSTYLDKLRSQITELLLVKDKYLSSTEIYYHNPNKDYSGIYVIGASVNHWGQSKIGHEAFQIELRNKFGKFLDYFALIEPLLPEKRLNDIQEVTKQVSMWIEKERNAPGPNVNDAIKNFSWELEKYSSTIELLQSAYDKNEKILVPDTNALISNPELSEYASFFKEKISIFILSTVIAELDKLKIFNKNEEVRKKARSIISRLKGYRKQGDIISEGVTISKSILLKLMPIEPDFDKTLSWLDPLNMDDRIIVSTLEIELKYLSSEVLLITNDLNLQNKAELAGIKYIDTDDVFL